MPRPERIVINTSPLITLVAALGDLTVLRSLYTEVLVPLEVCQEITAGGRDGFAVAEFEAANWLHKKDTYLNISPFLLNSLDLGEAAVIQLALDENIKTVCIDEAVGRRIARLNGLSLTGSIGILLRAKQSGYPLQMQPAIQRMQNRGIRLSSKVIDFALRKAEESDRF
jgi:predicted nucleic acid-binding protein